MIKLKIVDIVPQAEYAGTTYTQTIVGRLEDGTQVSIFDRTPISVSDDLLHSVLRASLLARASSVRKTTDIDPSIDSLEESGGYRFSGRFRGIERVGNADVTALKLDLGMGILYVQPDGEFLEAMDDEGAIDAIVAETYRTDLVDFEVLDRSE